MSRRRWFGRWLRRRGGLPAERRPALDRDERVVGWAATTAGSVVVATNRGLFLPGRDQRLGWHAIHKATWTGRELTITPAEVVEERAGYVVSADAPPLSVTLTDPGELPHVVRTRVTRSVSFSSHHPVPGGGARVVARRVPGIDGLTWAVRYDEGTDGAAPPVTAATDQLVAAHTAAQQTR